MCFFHSWNAYHFHKIRVGERVSQLLFTTYSRFTSWWQLRQLPATIYHEQPVSALKNAHVGSSAPFAIGPNKCLLCLRLPSMYGGLHLFSLLGSFHAFCKCKFHRKHNSNRNNFAMIFYIYVCICLYCNQWEQNISLLFKKNESDPYSTWTRSVVGFVQHRSFAFSPLTK
jgi:hypothetical protein